MTTIQSFSLGRIREGSTVFIIGQRNTGKTTLVRDILWHNRTIPFGIVVDGTGTEYSMYKNIIPKELLYEEFNVAIPREFVQRQVAICRNHKDEINKIGMSSIDPRAFFILDDCLYNSSWTHNRHINTLLNLSRSIQSLVVITMIYGYNVPPKLRSSVDYIFIAFSPLETNRRRVYDLYATDITSFEVFCNLMNNLTATECNMIVIDNTAQSNNIEDRIFYFTATQRAELCQHSNIKESKSS